jgi:hypothetical protein
MPRPGSAGDADTRRRGAPQAGTDDLPREPPQPAPGRPRVGPDPEREFPRPPRQITESVNDTFKDQPDPEQHGGRTPAGLMARVQQPIPALTAAIRHNDTTSQPVLPSLAADDH